jgi:phenylacetate-CoA ligase
MALEDYLHSLKGLYRVSPSWFKRSFGQIYALLPMTVRYGSLLNKAMRFLDESQWWSWQQHQQYQLQQIQLLLHHAYNNVPYYRRIMNEASVSADDFNSLEDLQKLPFLTKELVRNHKEELIAENMRGKKVATNTGGSTGKPLEFYWEHGRTRSLERAFMWRQWAWAGFRYGQKTCVIRGQTVREPLWHYDPIDRHLFVNSYNLSDSNCKLIVDKLRRFKPVSIQAYPSTLTILAAWMKEHQQAPLGSVRVLLCGSENLYPAQRQLFQQVFNTRVYGWYGHGESCCLAGYCEKQDYYHVYSEYGYVELIDEDGNSVPWQEGQRGEIVGTSFVNNTMPFIRYRTGDIAVVGPSSCTCGRNYRLLAKIEGRKQEYIVTSDGRAIALTGAVFGQHWHAFAKIRQIQFVQHEVGKVLVKIVKGPDFGYRDEEEIRNKLLGCVGSGLVIEFEYVNEIPLTSRGKHIFVKQSLSLPSAWAGSCDDNGPDL